MYVLNWSSMFFFIVFVNGWMLLVSYKLTQYDAASTFDELNIAQNIYI